MRSLLSILFVCLVLAGCTAQHVRHLPRNPWVIESPQSLTTAFWRFEYICQPLPQGVGIRGMAYPNSELFPEWATWYDSLAFTAYLSDSSGLVIDQSEITVLPRLMGKKRAISFEFTLVPDDSYGPYYLTFGYKTRLAENPWKPGQTTPKGKLYFTHQGALYE